jgi:hypothetical protein
MIAHSGTWDLKGDGWLHERRVLGVWFFKEITIQRWSPHMSELRREYGLRIVGCRLSVSHTVKQFKDKLG